MRHTEKCAAGRTSINTGARPGAAAADPDPAVADKASREAIQEKKRKTGQGIGVSMRQNKAVIGDYLLFCFFAWDAHCMKFPMLPPACEREEQKNPKP